MYYLSYRATSAVNIILVFSCYHYLLLNQLSHLSKLKYVFVLSHRIVEVSYIQGVPGGMCQTSGECSLC